MTRDSAPCTPPIPSSGGPPSKRAIAVPNGCVVISGLRSQKKTLDVLRLRVVSSGLRLLVKTLLFLLTAASH
jgi:hypothetical protein